MGLNGSSQCGVWSVWHRIRSWFYVQSRGISDFSVAAGMGSAIYCSFLILSQILCNRNIFNSNGIAVALSYLVRAVAGCVGSAYTWEISVYPIHLQLREDFRWRRVIMIWEILRCCTVLKVVLINKQRQLLSSRLLKTSLLNLTVWLLLNININGYLCAKGGFWLLL